LFEGDLRVSIQIFYASRRPDLDPSLIYDLMEDRIYKNDRQIKEQHLYWGLDKENPRSIIVVERMA
jgi:Holliday junction resolvase RusA-like endonuclease